MKSIRYFVLGFLTFIALGLSADAQQNTAQQAYAIFQQSCLGCHGEHGPFKEALVIDSAAGLIQSGAVVPGVPIVSELYTRLLEKDDAKRMPLNQPQLSPEAILTIGNWILAGAPSWEGQHDVTFITNDAMLTAIQEHLQTLDKFDQPSARYFTTTHLYNAGEGLETLRAAEVALSKLVNSLSWGFTIIKPEPIDARRTIFYIDLRDYEWDLRAAWTQIEGAYPYRIDFDATIHASLQQKLVGLQQLTESEVPFVQADWFLATASLPPLYHDILGLPETEGELERELGIDVARNLQRAPGISVWRAGTNDSGVSNHNRVVERHTFRYGAYWKSHDFAGSAGRQNIFTHPLSFERDGGEVIFNLPNGLQAYYIADGQGNRINEAPTTIVSNPAAKDPAVRNGLSCIGCHTEGMKTFKDGVRASIEKTARPSYDKEHALRLYVEQTVMDALVQEDTERYEVALVKTGGVSGGIEPVHLFHEAFHEALNAAQAAASLGLQESVFVEAIKENSGLQDLGLAGLPDGGNVKRDAWTADFSEIVACVYGDECPTSDLDDDDDRFVFDHPIPDENLRAAIAERLGKAATLITTEDIATRLTTLVADGRGIRDLRGLEHATRLERIELRHNAISDLTPLAGLTRLNNIKLRGNRITNVSPLAGLINVDWLGLEENDIRNLSPLKGLIKLSGLGIEGNPISDVSPLSGLQSLEGIRAWNTQISDFSPLADVPRLRWLEVSNSRSLSSLSSLKGLRSLRRLEINDCEISDLSGLEALTQLTSLTLMDNLISDVSPLQSLKALTHLNLRDNIITDVSPLAALTRLKNLVLDHNAIADLSPLEELLEKINISFGNNPGFPRGGPKIAGPWLWVVLPQGNFLNGTDLLAQASNGKISELGVSTHGAIQGDPVGEVVWIAHKIDTQHGNNMNNMANALGIATGDVNNHVAYGSVVLYSPRQQTTRLFAGSDNNHKIWLNGELVREKLSWSWAHDYQEFFPITLKQGKNVLLVAVHAGGGWWSGFFGFAPDADYTVLAPGARFTLSTETPQVQVGDTFTLRLLAENVTDFAGWQGDVTFNPAMLKANRVNEGDFLKQDSGRTFFQRGTINNQLGKITRVKAARLSEGAVNGEGTLLSVSFTAKAAGKTRLRLRNFQAGTLKGETIPTMPPELVISVEGRVARPAWDVNEDGITDAGDLLLVTVALGQKPPENPRTDVNGDGVVDGKDAALVAEHLGEGDAPAAPGSGWVTQSDSVVPANLTPETIIQALDILRAADDGSLPFQRGIAKLEHLLTLFIPGKTALFANYPNPFNPETWIPYQLAEHADVTLRIYSIDGRLIRTLAIGYQPAGLYQYQSRAVYWDGRNALGEPVASGVYFYTLTAGAFTATRRMLILK
ncbi:hypothetical protein C6500_06370 [Candidatus Poribacteria bacterium]|nr:MAG: hypothetical protein C6500_06370 [Candidatus Poribacteria bacterium]